MSRFGAILPAAMLLCVGAGCGSQPQQPDWAPRMDEMSQRVSELENRVAQFERATPEGREAAAQEASAARLERLRAGQRQIEQNTNMMCDATAQC